MDARSQTQAKAITTSRIACMESTSSSPHSTLPFTNFPKRKTEARVRGETFTAGLCQKVRRISSRIKKNRPASLSARRFKEGSSILDLKPEPVNRNFLLFDAKVSRLMRKSIPKPTLSAKPSDQ